MRVDVGVALGANAKDVSLELAELMIDEALTDFTIYVLPRLDETAKKQVVTKIAEKLKEDDPLVRSSAAFAIERIGKLAKETAPEIAELLKDDDSDVRCA